MIRFKHDTITAKFSRKCNILLDKAKESVYNIHIKKTKTQLFGRITMANAKNYTEEMVDAMVADYQSNPTKETVEKLSAEFGKTTRSIVAKLVREGVYVAAPRVTKTGAPVVRKSDLVAQIQAAVGAELPTLEKASKADLEKLLAMVA